MQGRRSDKGLLQVVFLVDVNPTKWTEENQAKIAANALRLCVLKILRYSADRLCKRLSDLKWGFKCFSSNALLRDYGRHGFKEFKVESFEEFELQINRKFEDEFEKSKEAQQQPSNEQDGDEVVEMVDSLKPLPAKCLTCSLTELVHDFEWDQPDICSPVKRTRSQTGREDTRNIVFLLSNAPCSEEAMKVFTGVHVKTPESFRSAVVPPALIRQFKEKCRIGLFWIDIGMLDQKQRQQDDSCQFIVQDFVKEMGGALIPMSSLLCLGDERNNLSLDITAVLPDKLDLSEMTSPAGSLAIPFSSAMDYYMGQQTDNHSDTFSPVLQHIDNADLWSGWLCTSGAEGRLCCWVNINPLFSHTMKSHDSGRPTSNNNLGEKDAAVISFGISKMMENSNETTECNESRKQEKRVFTGDGGQQGTQDVCLTVTLEGSESLSAAEGIAQTITQPNLFWIGGVVERNAVCPSWLHPTRAYSVISMTHHDTDEQRVAALPTQPSSQVLSGWFQELLCALARENLLMMLEFCDPVTRFPVTGLLQSLTSVCGIVSVINSDMLVMVEKLLLLQGRRMVPAAMTLNLSREDLPRELRMAEDKCAELKTRPLEYGEVHCNVNAKCIGHNQAEGVKAVGHFSSGNLEMWHTQLDCSASVSSAWKQLECSQDEEEEEEGLKESALMRELKKLYSSKKKTTGCGDKSPNQLHAKVKQLEQTSNVRPVVDSAHTKEHIAAAFQEKQCSSESECTRDGPAATRCDEGDKADQIESVDFKDEEEMASFLTQKYAKLLSEDSELLSGVKEMTAVISHFMVQCFPENSTEQFIRDKFLTQNERLKEKYQQKNEPSVKMQRIIEYKLQILLRLEVGLLVQDESSDVLIDEVIVMLRAISFLTDAAFLGTFMRDVVVQGYGGQIPKLLCAVYEGLMQEPPRELLSPSHVPTEDISPLRRMSVKPSSILRQDSDQPRSGGGRVLTRHMSVSDVGGKRREIVVPGNVKVKLPQKKEKQHALHHKEKNAREGSKGGKQKAVPGGQKTPVKKVRRNLFTDDGSANGPDAASRLKLRKDRTRHSAAGSSSKIVQDTPARKQLSNALWQEQHRARKRSCTATEVKVIMESPLRDVQAGENVPRRSPRRSSGAVFQRSRSFYGRSASSRSLTTRTKSFTAVGSRQSPGNLSSEPGDGSLDSQNATSSSHFSQSHKKRFALHSLLSSVCNSDAQKGKTKSGTPPPNTKKTAVRSSPRLMKKRSFSCIGFTTMVPLGTSSSPLKTCEIVKSRMNSVGGEVFSGIITTPEKARLLSPIRRSPRLKKRQEKSSETEIVEDKRTCNTSVENSLVTAQERSSVSSDRPLGNLGDVWHMQQIPENEPIKEQWPPGATVARSPALKSAKETPSDGHRGTSSRLRSHAQSQEINQPNVNASLTKIPKSFPSNSSGASCSPKLRDRRPLNRTPTKEAVAAEIFEVHTSVKAPHKSAKKTPSKGGRGSSTVSTYLCTLDSTKKSATKGSNLQDFDLEDIVVQLAPVNGEIVSKTGVQKDGLSCASECVDTSSAKTPNDHSAQEKGLQGIVDVELNTQIMENAEIHPWASVEQTSSAQVVRAYEEEVCRSSIRESTHASQARPQDNQISRHLSEGKDDLLKSSKVSSGSGSSRKVCDTPQSSPAISPQLMLLRDRPATPSLPCKRTKKRAGSVTGSPVEAERLSPLNRILKQRKRKRDDVSKTCNDAVFSQSPLRGVKVFLPTSHCEKSHKRETAEKAKPDTTALELASSRTSSDENDWFSEIENELDKTKLSCGHNESESSRTTPPRKRRRINKSKVFGTSGFSRGNPRGSTKRLAIPSSLSNDILAFEEDTFKGSPVHRRSKHKQLSKTPISAISLKMLRESPILCNDESLLGRTQEFDGSPVSGQEMRVEQQKRRHFPRAIDSLDVSAAGFKANSAEGVKLRKRLKLGTS